MLLRVRLEKCVGPISIKSPLNNSSVFSNLFLPNRGKICEAEGVARVHGIYINLEVSISMRNGSGRETGIQIDALCGRSAQQLVHA